MFACEIAHRHTQETRETALQVDFMIKFRFQGFGSRVLGSGCRVSPACRRQPVDLRTKFRVQGSGFRVQGSGFKVQGPGFRLQGSTVLRTAVREAARPIPATRAPAVPAERFLLEDRRGFTI